MVHLELRKAGDDSSWCSIVQGAQIFVGSFSSPSLMAKLNPTLGVLHNLPFRNLNMSFLLVQFIG